MKIGDRSMQAGTVLLVQGPSPAGPHRSSVPAGSLNESFGKSTFSDWYTQCFWSMSIEPALGLCANVVKPMLYDVRKSLMNCWMTRLAEPSLLAGESASPSQVLVAVPVKLIVCVIVCEFPKTISRFGGTLSASGRRKSLASAAAGSDVTATRANARRKRRYRVIFSSLGNAQQLRINANIGIDRFARLDCGGVRSRRQGVDVFDDLAGAVSLALGLNLVAGKDRIAEKDGLSDRHCHVRSPRSGIVGGDAHRHGAAEVNGRRVQHPGGVFDARVRGVEDFRDLGLGSGERLFDGRREHERNAHDRDYEEEQDREEKCHSLFPRAALLPKARRSVHH